jgi:hypothetical protein
MTMALADAKAIVVTRCLSPLGTGNDETGFCWRFNTSIGGDLNMAHRKISAVDVTHTTKQQVRFGALHLACGSTVQLTPQLRHQEDHP